MEFFNTKNARRIDSKPPRISFNVGGIIIFNNIAAKLFLIKVGTKIEFSYDDKNNEWFFLKSKNESAFSIRKVGTNSLGIQSSYIKNKIFETSGIYFKSARLLIGLEPKVIDGVNYYSIITSSAKEIAKRKNGMGRKTYQDLKAEIELMINK